MAIVSPRKKPREVMLVILAALLLAASPAFPQSPGKADPILPSPGKSNQAPFSARIDALTPEGKVSGVSPVSIPGVCPVTVRFKGRIVSPGAGEVTYRFVRSDGGKMAAKTLMFDQPGAQMVETSWRLVQNFSGWVAVEIESPHKFRSNQAKFEVVCSKDGSAPPPPPSSSRTGFSVAQMEELAKKFAPIVYHSSDESNFPTNVDWFLQKTELWFYDDACTPDLHKIILRAPTQKQLAGLKFKGGCSGNDTVSSGGTRSKDKHRTFYLKDVPEAYRIGSRNTKQDWTTYFHAYPNDLGGVTIQYWRFYAYNDAANNHGGDWEGIHLVLDRAMNPAKVGLLGHTNIDYLKPTNLKWEGNHVLVYSEGGGHATRSAGNLIKARGGNGVINPSIPKTFVRQETWPGGRVNWFNGKVSEAGPLVNLGSKTAPMNGQVFVRYSGIWGSPGTFFGTSGYWGPAFNETGMGGDGFITAWCAGMTGPVEEIRKECYPTGVSR